MKKGGVSCWGYHPTSRPTLGQKDTPSCEVLRFAVRKVQDRKQTSCGLPAKTRSRSTRSWRAGGARSTPAPAGGFFWFPAVPHGSRRGRRRRRPRAPRERAPPPFPSARRLPSSARTPASRRPAPLGAKLHCRPDSIPGGEADKRAPGPVTGRDVERSLHVDVPFLGCLVSLATIGSLNHPTRRVARGIRGGARRG